MKYGIYGLVLYLSSERGEMEEKKWDCEFSSNPPIITLCAASSALAESSLSILSCLF